jgi:hypothetical protein
MNMGPQSLINGSVGIGYKSGELSNILGGFSEDPSRIMSTPGADRGLTPSAYLKDQDSIEVFT